MPGENIDRAEAAPIAPTDWRRNSLRGNLLMLGLRRLRLQVTHGAQCSPGLQSALVAVVCVGVPLAATIAVPDSDPVCVAATLAMAAAPAPTTAASDPQPAKPKAPKLANRAPARNRGRVKFLLIGAMEESHFVWLRTPESALGPEA